MRYYGLFLLLALPVWGHAQMYDGVACEPDPFARERLGEIESEGHPLGSYVLTDGPTGAFSNWSTSFLKPSGSAPAKTWTEGETPEPDQEEEWAIARDEWSCMYSAMSAQDGRPETAWVEGVKGYGKGEKVVIAWGKPDRPLEIWAGYGKSESLHKKNSRPKTVRVHLMTAEYIGANQYGMTYDDIWYRASCEVTLKDYNGYQPLPLSESFQKMVTSVQTHSRPEDIDWPEDSWVPLLIAIEILDVYPGSKWDDVCISEVRWKPFEK